MINYYTFILIEEVILWLIAFKQYRTIINVDTTILFCHQKKSITDTYREFCILIPIHIVLCHFRLFFCLMERQSVNVFLFRAVWYVLLILFFSLMVPILIYMATEIKHISPYDSIGEKIQSDKKANIFYIKEFFLGIIVLINCVVQSLYGSMIVGWLIIIYIIFLFYFGMADVLQDTNYNSPDYEYLYKNKKMYEKYFIPQLFQFCINKEYRCQHVEIANENIKNIKNGMRVLGKIIFKTICNKLE